jgi:hypothetical protein
MLQYLEIHIFSNLALESPQIFICIVDKQHTIKLDR